MVRASSISKNSVGSAGGYSSGSNPYALGLGKKVSGETPGSFAGSFRTTASDAERIERMMAQAKCANKSIVKYFGKHIEEFRRDQAYCREIVFLEVSRSGTN